METLQPGQVIGGCRIESKIASGGMGTVYKARQLILDRQVAIKVLNPELSRDEEVIKRFIREGKLAAKLDHPNIVRIHDIGQDQNQYYMVMEYVEGMDLSNRILECGRLAPHKALGIIRTAALALDYAHRQGIVHRDIKPHNIMVTTDGVVKVADFGIARLMEQDTMLTMSGMILGTPAFMSPEQCRGEVLDGRSDLYNLGATLYTLMSGRLPFPGQACAALLLRVVNDLPPPLESLVPELPPSVTALVKRLMAKHPGARHQSGKELAGAIDAIFRSRLNIPQEPEPAGPGPLRQLAAWLQSHLLAAGVVILLGAALYVLWPRLAESWATSRGGEQPGEAPAIVEEVPEEEPPEAEAPPIDPMPVTDFPVDEIDPEAGGDADPELDHRVSGMAEAFLQSDLKEVLSYIDPGFRGPRYRHDSLERILEAIRNMGSGVGSQHRIEMQSSDRARVALVFERPGVGLPILIRLNWILHDGAWYVRPDLEPNSNQVPRRPRRRFSRD